MAKIIEFPASQPVDRKRPPGRDLWPAFMEYEAALPRQRYPRKFTHPELGDLEIRYRLSQWERMEDAEGDTLRRRSMFGWLERGRSRVGAIEVWIYDFGFALSPQFIHDQLDQYSQAEHDMSCVVLSEWEDFGIEVAVYGPLVWIEMAWAERNAIPMSIGPAACLELIETIAPHYSVLVTQAFPLEYASRVDPSGPRLLALEDRQAAMVRFYNRLFGVERMPGPPGVEGWLWRASPRAASSVPAPTYTTAWANEL